MIETILCVRVDVRCPYTFNSIWPCPTSGCNMAGRFCAAFFNFALGRSIWARPPRCMHGRTVILDVIGDKQFYDQRPARADFVWADVYAITWSMKSNRYLQCSIFHQKLAARFVWTSSGYDKNRTTTSPVYNLQDAPRQSLRHVDQL